MPRAVEQRDATADQSDLAAANQVGNAGFINTLLYQNPQAFNDIKSGSNIDYHAKTG